MCKKERNWRTESTEYNFMTFKHQRKHVSSAIRRTRKSYYNDIFEEDKHDFKFIYKLINSLLF